METIGSRIRALRKKKGLAQEKLASASGLSTQTIYRIEKNISTPDIKTLHSLAKTLEIDFPLLTEGTDLDSRKSAQEDYPAWIYWIGNEAPEDLTVEEKESLRGIRCFGKSPQPWHYTAILMQIRSFAEIPQSGPEDNPVFKFSKN